MTFCKFPNRIDIKWKDTIFNLIRKGEFMKQFNSITIFVMFALFSNAIFAQDKGSKNCTWNLTKEKTSLTWTGFKTSKKIAVSGKFDEMDITNNESANSLKELLESIKVSIPLYGINSQSDIRDKKLLIYLFGGIKDLGNITGRAINYNPKTHSGRFELALNGVKRNVELKATNTGSKWLFKGTLDLMDFDMGGNIATLNEACKALHTGEDGKAKTWTEAEVVIETEINYEC